MYSALQTVQDKATVYSHRNLD